LNDLSDRPSQTETTLDAMARMAADGNAGWTTLPPDAYCNPEIHALEVEHIFKAGWIAIGRADEVAEAGSFLTREIVGEPIAMIRGQDGILRVFSNICRHRWMKLLDGRGRKAVITCPYHAWVYGLDGALRKAPDMDQHPTFKVDDIRLGQLHHEIWQGFVYVNLDGRAEPLASRLSDLTPRIAAYGLDDWVTAGTVECFMIPWDWKVMQDNGECYHHAGLHPRTFQDVFPGEEAGAVTGNDWTMLWTPARDSLLETTASGETLMPDCYFEPLEGLDDFQRTNFMLVYVLPNFFIYLQPDCGLLIRVEPIAAGRCNMSGDLIVPRQAQALPDYQERLDRFTAFFNRFNDEDTPVNTAIQKALESGRGGPAPLSHLEAHNRHVAWWVASKLAGATATRTKSKS
jgi:phenylpropionate dioxygenase-like ring-hydroxylating dioxygenase large terminal subunit